MGDFLLFIQLGGDSAFAGDAGLALGADEGAVLFNNVHQSAGALGVLLACLHADGGAWMAGDPCAQAFCPGGSCLQPVSDYTLGSGLGR